MKIIYPQSLQAIDFSAASRQSCLEEISGQDFDLCVIGGGITGVGIARDAAMRGLKTLVIEKNDFGSGTSNHSSKLVHGGLRYLKQFEFKLVRLALKERYQLIKLAPHLVKSIPCFFPIFRHTPESFLKMKSGMILYDLLAGREHLSLHHMLRKRLFLKQLPQIRQDNLWGSALYYDAQTDDARLVLATIQSAVVNGCRAISYLKAEQFETAGERVTSLQARDILNGKSYTIRARAFVNAAGPWSDQVRRSAHPGLSQRIITTSGIHLVVSRKRLPLDNAVMLISIFDRRPLFAIPWKNVVLLGTTDNEYQGDLDSLSASREDVDYLLKSFNHYFPDAKLDDQDIISTYMGIRPLVMQKKKRVSEVSREHAIFQEPGNVFNIIGGKLTTYRQMAADVLSYINKHTKKLSIPGSCETASHPLYGGEVRDFADFTLKAKKELKEKYNLDEDVAANLLETYGSHICDITAIIDQEPRMSARFLPDAPFIWAQLPYAIKHEMALTVEDFLDRRTHILSLYPDQGLSLVSEVADYMAGFFNWDKEEKEKQKANYIKTVELTKKFRKYP